MTRTTVAAVVPAVVMVAVEEEAEGRAIRSTAGAEELGERPALAEAAVVPAWEPVPSEMAVMLEAQAPEPTQVTRERV
jgi:hypothetical protein